MSKRLVKFDFDPLDGIDIQLKSSDKKQLLDAVANYVKESVLSSIGDGVSPVTGDHFPKLSKDYASKQKSGNRLANLELSGDLLDSLSVKVLKGSTLRITVDSDQQGKADGHCKFNKDNNDRIPARPFIPGASSSQSKFSDDIESGIKDVIDNFLADLESS